jgi:Planctomycete cytochrome C
MISSRFARWNLLGTAAALILIFILVSPSGESATWARFIGRFHPGIVHLPVGILLFALILRVFRAPESVTNVALVTGCWSALLSVAAGSWLAQMGAYPADTILSHKILGYCVALLTAALLFARFEYPTPLLTGSMWAVITGTLVIGGDLGGVLTRGETYTTEFAPGFVQSLLDHPDPMATRFVLDDPDSASVYKAIIAPILVEKCSVCHGEVREEEGLDLRSPDGMAAYDGEDPLIVAGRPLESLLYQLVSLPEGHEDQMPPQRDASSISHADVELIKWWIAEGASFDQSIADTPMTDEVKTILAAYGLGEILTGIFALDVPLPDTAAVARLRQSGARVDALSLESPFLSVRCETRAECFEGEASDALRAVSAQVASLDVSSSDISDVDLSTLTALIHLVRLDISETDINGTGLSSLVDLHYLTFLNLFGTNIEDEQLNSLHSIKSLESVYLWQTSVSEDAVTLLRAALPEARINAGRNN